jgi:hypothetical protein
MDVRENRTTSIKSTNVIVFGTCNEQIWNADQVDDRASAAQEVQERKEKGLKK